VAEAVAAGVGMETAVATVVVAAVATVAEDAAVA
jgi:hypothetical protein